jgi:hypothetical protein
VAAFGFQDGTRFRTVQLRSPTNTTPKEMTKPNIRDVLLAWISQWCHDEMGNTQQLTEDDKHHVQAVSRRELHKEFLDSPTHAKVRPDNKKECGSYQSFCRCIKTMNAHPDLPTIKFHKHKAQQECARCTALKFLIRSAKRRKATSELNNYRLKLLQHRTQAKWERLAYQIRMAAGSERKRAWSIGMDGYCSFKSSCFTIKVNATLRTDTLSTCKSQVDLIWCFL